MPVQAWRGSGHAKPPHTSRVKSKARRMVRALMIFVADGKVAPEEAQSCGGHKLFVQHEVLEVEGRHDLFDLARVGMVKQPPFRLQARHHIHVKVHVRGIVTENFAAREGLHRSIAVPGVTGGDHGVARGVGLDPGNVRRFFDQMEYEIDHLRLGHIGVPWDEQQ